MGNPKKPDCDNCNTLKDCFNANPTDPYACCSACDKMNMYQKHLESRRKFTKGEPILSIEEVLKQDWVYIFGRPKHKQVIVSLTVRTLLLAIQRKSVFRAIRKEVQHD